MRRAQEKALTAANGRTTYIVAAIAKLHGQIQHTVLHVYLLAPCLPLLPDL